MTDGLVLPPGAGRAVPGAGMALKVGAEQSTAWSVFEAEVTPGFDVGAHLHQSAEELFYILDGELELLAFEPVARTAGDWQSWQSAAGARVMRGGPGSAMFVPAGCPHAFANPGTVPAWRRPVTARSCRPSSSGPFTTAGSGIRLLLRPDQAGDVMAGHGPGPWPAIYGDEGR
jgi:uncharacterized RmlC-like cupin family protein